MDVANGLPAHRENTDASRLNVGPVRGQWRKNEQYENETHKFLYGQLSGGIVRRKSAPDEEGTVKGSIRIIFMLNTPPKNCVMIGAEQRH
jgi:hypothetical protein